MTTIMNNHLKILDGLKLFKSLTDAHFKFDLYCYVGRGVYHLKRKRYSASFMVYRCVVS